MTTTTLEDTAPEEKAESSTIQVVSESRSSISYTPEERRKVIRKLDVNLVPLCFTLYTFSILDRSNLGNAKIAGLAQDINIAGERYAWLGNAFYIAYIIFQFNTLGSKVFKPHKWVTFVVLFWRTVSTLQAACTNWQGLMACRFFLGWAETGRPLEVRVENVPSSEMMVGRNKGRAAKLTLVLKFVRANK